MHRQHGSGSLVLPSNLTVGQWVDRWLAEKEAAVRPKTVAVYRQVLAHLTARVGRVRISRLTAALLAACFTDLARAGVGSRVRQQMYTYGRQCFARAVRLDLLALNPFDRMDKPRHTPKEQPVWTVAEAGRFLAACQASPLTHAPLCALALLTGLRRGELCGLRWADIDLAGAVLQVRRQRVTVAGVPSTGPLKTRAGRRTVPLPSAAVMLLHRLPRPLWPEAPVFATSQGTPPHPDNLKRTLVRLCADAGVPSASLHHLRHVYASLLVAGGLDVRSAAAVLGHSRPSVTLDLYAAPLGAGRAGQVVGEMLGRVAGVGG